MGSTLSVSLRLDITTRRSFLSGKRSHTVVNVYHAVEPQSGGLYLQTNNGVELLCVEEYTQL